MRIDFEIEFSYGALLLLDEAKSELEKGTYTDNKVEWSWWGRQAHEELTHLPQLKHIIFSTMLGSTLMVLWIMMSDESHKTFRTDHWQFLCMS